MSTMSEAPYTVSHNYCAIRGNTVQELLDNLRAFNANDEVGEEIAAFKAIVGGNSMSNAVGTAKAVLGGEVIERQSSGPETVEDKHGSKYTYNHPDAREIEPGVQEILREWTDKNNKARKAWVDPCRGPKPFSPGDRDRDYIRWA